MTRDIIIPMPDDDFDIDGYEEVEDPEDAYQRDWEMSTFSW
ncbi:hypothetical protein [Parabacteroides leei]|nr:hypothetical protein [Parabacteroides leei]